MFDNARRDKTHDTWCQTVLGPPPRCLVCGVVRFSKRSPTRLAGFTRCGASVLRPQGSARPNRDHCATGGDVSVVQRLIGSVDPLCPERRQFVRGV